MSCLSRCSHTGPLKQIIWENSCWCDLLFCWGKYLITTSCSEFLCVCIVHHHYYSLLSTIKLVTFVRQALMMSSNSHTTSWWIFNVQLLFQLLFLKATRNIGWVQWLLTSEVLWLVWLKRFFWLIGDTITARVVSNFQHEKNNLILTV